MITTILCDFGRVLINTKDKNYLGSHDELHLRLSQNSDYKVTQHFVFNEELMSYLSKFKDKYKMYVFTAGIVYKEPDIKSKLMEVFKGIYTEDKGPKNKPESYINIAQHQQVKPEEILFIDDNLENINAAKKANCQVILYQSNEQLLRELKSLL